MSYLTSSVISPLAVELLRRSLVLPGTVSRVSGAEYQGSGGTVTVRVPRPRSARTQVTPGATITFDDVEELGVDVTIAHLYNAALVTDEDLTLSIVDFGRQVLRPQVTAIAEGAEDQLAAVMNGLDPHPTIAFAAEADPEDTRSTILAIREELTRRKVPASDRWLAVAPDIATRILSVPGFVEADKRGNATALESAVIGELYGLHIVESPALEEGGSVGYHSSAFVWANRPPALTAGMNGSIREEEGISLRHALPFLGDRLSSASVVSTFAGASVVVDDDEDNIERAVRVEATPAT